jgi:hypothetical protein
MVEAPGIEARWREVGFGGSRGVSFAKTGKTSRSREGAKNARSVSICLAGSDCSNEVRLISQAIVALDAGDPTQARAVLSVVLDVLSADGEERGV